LRLKTLTDKYFSQIFADKTLIFAEKQKPLCALLSILPAGLRIEILKEIPLIG